MQKKYITPTIDIIKMINDDVVTTSPSDEGNDIVNCPAHYCGEEANY